MSRGGENCKWRGQLLVRPHSDFEASLSTSFKVVENKLNGARWTPSPHYSARPPWASVELVVVHCISLPEGQYGTGAPERLFLGRLDCGEHPTFSDLQGVEVSAHLLVNRDGNVQQFVNFDQQAWHAGSSCWGGRERCNQFSIGIEVEGTVDEPFEDVQIDALAAVLNALFEHYEHLSVNHIVGHQDIASGRKTDPGPFFDWQGLFNQLT